MTGRSHAAWGKCTFPRKRLVKSCTSRLRGDATGLAARSMTIRGQCPRRRHESTISSARQITGAGRSSSPKAPISLVHCHDSRSPACERVPAERLETFLHMASATVILGYQTAFACPSQHGYGKADRIQSRTRQHPEFMTSLPYEARLRWRCINHLAPCRVPVRGDPGVRQRAGLGCELADDPG